MKYLFLLILFINNPLYPYSPIKISYQVISNQDTVIIHSSIKSLIFISEFDTIKVSDFGYDDKDYIINVKVIDSETDSLLQIVSDTGDYWEPSLKFIDINLDGYLDMEFYVSYSNLVPIYSFWIYDSAKSLFIYSDEYSVLNDYSIDIEKREIESFAQSTGGRGGYTEKYKIVDGHLSLFETESSNYYDYERQEVINGVLKTVALEKEDWAKDDEGNHLSIIEIYKLVNDSLLSTEKNWLTAIGMPYPDDISDNDIYNCGPWGGCLKYLRKEVYSYDIESNGYIIKDTTRYQVINNKWEIVKAFNK